jgi:hypothetical protein
MSDFEFDEDYGYGGVDPYEDVIHEEEYTGRPIPYSNTMVGSTHADGCEWVNGDYPDKCSCKELWEAKFHRERDQELEDLHEEYWT